MAVKYELIDVRKRIVDHLQADWPTSLREWDNLEAYKDQLMSSFCSVDIDEDMPEPVATIVLARKFDIPCVLPAAFYLLSTMRMVDDYDVHRAYTGVEGDELDVNGTFISCEARTARWSLLGVDEFRCLCRGREKLAEHALSVSFLGDLNNFSCKQACLGAYKQYESWIQQEFLENRDLLSALHRDRGFTKHLLGQMCVDCRFKVFNKAERLRFHIWAGLSEDFNLQSLLDCECLFLRRF